MAAMPLPPPVIRALDALHRAFLWAAVECVSGAQCLVAWVDVCRPKDEENRCLLTKLLHYLHSNVDSPWARWVWRMIGEHPLYEGSARELPDAHWSLLCALVPLYRSVSMVQVGNGVHSAFWLDSWLPAGALAVMMLALFSHTTNANASVAQVLRHGLDSVLVPRLMAVGARERVELAGLLASISLREGADVRVLTWCKAPGGHLRASELYRLSCFGGVAGPSAQFV
jgi:hypothetical protein